MALSEAPQVSSAVTTMPEIALLFIVASLPQIGTGGKGEGGEGGEMTDQKIRSFDCCA